MRRLRSTGWGTGLVLAALTCAAYADDWTNSGGNAGRNGRTTEIGPDAATPLWPANTPIRSAIIAYQPVIQGSRVFMVRQSQFAPETTGSPVVAQDLDTGAELWATHVPVLNSSDWTTWVAGVSNGQVYAARSGNGASVSDKLFALRQTDGGENWRSVDLIDAGPYDGVVFAPNGDPIVASFRTIKRIRATDGTTAWTASRLCSVSGNCGAAVAGLGVYVADAAVGGHVIKKFNIDTGAFQYQSPVMAGFTIQTTPMAAPDGTIYLPRVQNNVNVDFFYAMTDTGSAISFRWPAPVPAGYGYSNEFTVNSDGSVYMWAPGNVIKRLSPVDGSTLNTSPVITIDFPAAPRMACDAQGRVFFSNGGFGNGKFYSFNADLTQRWSIPVPNINIGAPAIGRDGTLVIAGVGTNVKAYRTPRTILRGDLNCDGVVDANDAVPFALGLIDAAAYMAAYPTCDIRHGDMNLDTTVDGADIQGFVAALP